MPESNNHISLITLITLLALLFSIHDLSAAPNTEMTESLDNWSTGNDIMIDAFSNNVMSPAPVTYNALSTDNAIIESTLSCIGGEASCATTTAGPKLKYEEVVTPGFSYLRLTLINTSTSSRVGPTQISYIFEMLLPYNITKEQTAGNFLYGLTSRPIIRDHIDKFLYSPDAQNNILHQSTHNIASAENIFTNRLSQSFSTTDIELNFSDKNFQEFTTGFAEKTKKTDINQKTIQITKKTNIDEANEISAPKLLTQTQAIDNSGINNILWLENDDTSTTQADATSSENQITLSYQRIDNLSKDASIKEIDQDLPQPVNPFNWSPNSSIDFNTQSLFK